jgi:MobA/MobL family
VAFSLPLPHRSGDDRNHHAHILTTTREVTAVGLGNKSSIELSDTDRRKKGLEPSKVEVKAIRELWAVLTNEHLLEQGVKARVDHRSLEEQGINRVPTTHLGPAVSALERRGVETEVGKRIAWQRAELAQERLERAAELGKIERERAQVEKSILDLSGDVGSARRERRLKAPDRVAADPLTRSTQRLAEQLKELGPVIKGPDAKPNVLETPALLMPSDRGRRGGQDWPLGQAPESESTAPRPPASRRDEAARERERLAAMNSRELWAEIQKIRPPTVDHLVELDPSVAGARGAVERHQREAAQALQAANWAEAQGYTWRQAHGVQAALHDRGMKMAPYLVARAVAVADAQRVRAEALKAAGMAQAEYARARAEASPRIAQETAPARAKVVELRELAGAADKREQVATEFERLARKAARSANQDMGQEWQATPKVLRDAIERYNRERPEVQKEILKAIASRPEAAQKLEEAIEVRRTQAHDRDYDLGL